MADPQSTLEHMNQLFSDDPNQRGISAAHPALQPLMGLRTQELQRSWPAANFPTLLDSGLQLATPAASTPAVHYKIDGAN